MTTQKPKDIDVAGCLDANAGAGGDTPVQVLNSGATPPAHTRNWWGDMWNGTKDQLQAIGIGAGVVFPGEPGGPVHELKVRDGRSMLVRIRRSADWERGGPYNALRSFWDDTDSLAARRRERTTVFAPDVDCYRDEYRDDVFTGTADALVAARLIDHDQLPGQPGRGKVRCTYLVDGTRVHKGQNRAWTPGYRAVERLGKNRFRVTVCVTDEEAEVRRCEREAYEAFKERAIADARAALEQEESLERRQRGHLRLVWSRF